MHWVDPIRAETPRLSDYASHTNSHTLKCEIHQKGVVPPSVEALRKGENDSDWIHCNAIIRVIVSIFQDRVGSECTK